LLPVLQSYPILLKSLSYIAAYYSSGPSQRLNGNWLAEAGFSTDTPVMVSVEQGRLVIEPVRG